MVDFSDTIRGLTNISWQYGIWQACESYLSPLGSDTSYKARNGFYMGEKVIYLDRFNFSNRCTTATALKVASYAFFVLPAIALIVKAGYRWWYADRLLRPIDAEPGKPLPKLVMPHFNPTENRNGSNGSTYVNYPKLPDLASSSRNVEPKLVEPKPVVLSLASFKDIVSKVNEYNLSDDEQEVLCCSQQWELYTSTGDNRPVFIAEEEDTFSFLCAHTLQSNLPQRLAREKDRLANERAALLERDPKAEIEIKEATVTGLRKEVKKITYFDNPGHLVQMRRDETGAFYWVEPLTGVRLGQSGFEEPYFCPDGYTYNLKNISTYCQQYRDNHPGEKIPSPTNPNFIFQEEFITVYPNRLLFARTGLNNQPKDNERVI